MSNQKSRGRTVAATTKKSQSGMYYIIIAVVALIGIGAVIYSSIGGDSQTASGTPGILPVERNPSIPVGKTDDGRYFYGNADAPITVVEYADFQCPGCGYYATSVSSGFQRDYVVNGKARVIFQDFPLGSHANAVSAAVAARCAGEQSPTSFWKMHDMIFVNQRQWSNLPKASLNGQFVTYAGQLSLDTEAFSQCLAVPEIERKVREHQQGSLGLNLPGTPSFAVNGTVLDMSSAQSIEEMDVIVRNYIDTLQQ
jgi:protein-disulfide isomerase